jgi:hypothetical protein
MARGITADENGTGDTEAGLSLSEELRHQRQALCKWGRMLNALIALLEDKGVTSKGEVLIQVYERLNGSARPERAEGVRSDDDAG